MNKKSYSPFLFVELCKQNVLANFSFENRVAHLNSYIIYLWTKKRINSALNCEANSSSVGRSSDRLS